MLAARALKHSEMTIITEHIVFAVYFDFREGLNFKFCLNSAHCFCEDFCSNFNLNSVHCFCGIF